MRNSIEQTDPYTLALNVSREAVVAVEQAEMRHDEARTRLGIWLSGISLRSKKAVLLETELVVERYEVREQLTGETPAISQEVNP